MKIPARIKKSKARAVPPVLFLLGGMLCLFLLCLGAALLKGTGSASRGQSPEVTAVSRGQADATNPEYAETDSTGILPPDATHDYLDIRPPSPVTIRQPGVELVKMLVAMNCPDQSPACKQTQEDSITRASVNKVLIFGQPFAVTRRPLVASGDMIYGGLRTNGVPREIYALFTFYADKVPSTPPLTLCGQEFGANYVISPGEILAQGTYEHQNVVYTSILYHILWTSDKAMTMVCYMHAGDAGWLRAITVEYR